MAQPPPLAAVERHDVSVVSKSGVASISLASLSRALSNIDGACYSFAVDGDGSLRLEWQAGSVAGTSTLPISEFLGDRLPAPEALLVRRHLDCLVSGNESGIELEWPIGSRKSLPVRDRAIPEFDSSGRIKRVVGSLQALPFDLSSCADGRVNWDRFIVESVEQGISCWDSDERLVLANQRFRALFGDTSLALEPGLSLSDFITAVASSAFYAIEGEQGDRSLQLGDTIRSRRRCELQVSDGRLLQLQSSSVATGTLVTVQDVTTVRSAEGALRSAKMIAEQADQKKSRFLRAANHDLRQPLATLKILIYSSLDPTSEEHRRELLHSMDVSASIMEDILGSLLQIGQLDAGKIVPRVNHFQLSQLFERSRIEFAPQAEIMGLTFKVIANHATVMSDRALLERIVSNLVANALRFTQKGKVLLGARRRGNFVDIEVHDTGCGIPEEQLELIFEEFHQVGDSKDRSKGLGLGLNIVHRLAEILQHKVSVRSQVARGSVFSVSVPVGNVWQSEIGEPEISERIGGEFRGMGILLVDDDEMLRTTMQQLLERWGANVVTTAEADKAAELLARGDWHPDIILADYRLPRGRNGTEVIKEIRALTKSEIPGIILTADTDPVIIARIRNSGLPVLIKPISPPRLRSLMHHLLFEEGGKLSY
uniref:PAS domain-containing hybrid sensor histidine kinase/response regulator n=1 Tax=Aminobacter niigataensis TaxID=83265 RepID=UPI002852D8BE|nr:ATP-binding protein [Aminobacter niigataensis]WMD00147.1 ATP-binding protein [Aminobacter niigataensis]